MESFLEASARRFPDKTALVCGSRRLTYQEIDRQSNCFARALIDSGIERGDRVAVFMENSVEVVIAIFAILKAGAVFLLINPTTKAEKLAYILNNCRARGLVGNAARLAAVETGMGEMPHLAAVWASGAPEDSPGRAPWLRRSLEQCLASSTQAPEAPAKRCIDMDLAALVYTSGSTGKPKGVMLTHLNICSAAESITTYLENTPADVILNVLPLSFDYGLYQVLMGFKIGGTVVLERSFAYPYSVIETAIREKVTGLPLVPTMASILLQLELDKYAFPHLRYITNTAAALPTRHIVRLRELFPHVRIYSMYGLTECKRVSYLPPEQIDVRPKSVGRGMPNEEVYILDEENRRVGPGVVGELVVRGSNVMKGYWELPEETDRVLRPGPFPWEKVLYTGDLFTADEEGYLYFVGRKDDIIKTRGEKVSPKEVEDVLYSLAAVQDAVVVGVPDELLGQAIKAVIVVRPGARLDDREVLRHCARHLEDFMVPKLVEFRAALPSTASGKISRRELGAAAGETL